MTFNFGAGGFGPAALEEEVPVAVWDAGTGSSPFACDRLFVAIAEAMAEGG
jgi:hypothetical protein